MVFQVAGATHKMLWRTANRQKGRALQHVAELCMMRSDLAEARAETAHWRTEIVSWRSVAEDRSRTSDAAEGSRSRFREDDNQLFVGFVSHVWVWILLFSDFCLWILILVVLDFGLLNLDFCTFGVFCRVWLSHVFYQSTERLMCLDLAFGLLGLLVFVNCMVSLIKKNTSSMTA